MSTGDQAGSAAARRQLGMRLRELREERGIAQAEAAAVIEGSESKISRLERGRLSFKEGDVRALLAHYQVDPEEWPQLLNLVLVANARPWWRQQFSDVMPHSFHPYMDLEAAARHIRTYEVQVIPGLLQTSDYTRALILASPLRVAPQDVERRIDLRKRRQEAVVASAVKFWAVIDEAALRRTIGTAGVMRDQLRYLCDCREQPGITIQVLPFRSGGCVADTTGFTIVRLNDVTTALDVPDLVYVEYLTGALCLDSTKEVDVYNEMFISLAAKSLLPDESADLIEKILIGH